MNVSDPDDLGRLDRVDGHVLVTFTRRLRQSPTTVWRALTEPDHLAAWFPSTFVGERVPGARLRFALRDDVAPPFDGEMLAYEPASLLMVRWGDEVLRFDVESDGAGTVLTLTVTFDEIGKGARDGAGWHACLDLLGYAVDGGEAPWSSADRWTQVHPTYVGRFGPEASTIGPPYESQRVHGRTGERSAAD
ncbi:MAG TPA: SRPBCC family protein [Acidimicrobiales bacterium]